MAEIKINIDEESLAQEVVNRIAAIMANDYTQGNHDAISGIRKGTEQAVKDFVYSRKEEIIDKCVSRAVAELVRKGLPILLDRFDRGTPDE